MKAATTASRYFHTLRHLKPVQIYGRAWFRLHRPRPDTAPAPPVAALTGWQTPAARDPSLIGPTRFRFLNEEGDAGEIGWTSAERPKLWRYNQHYFDDLNAKDASTRRDWHHALITDWIAQNAPGQGDGWEPYPASLRIVNWVKWAASGGELSGDARHSLAVQARWLTGRLEWHLLGNHLFANAKALVFAGIYFDGPEADGWLDRGLAILEPQIDAQFLSDGAQFELTPMYHALALEDALDLVNLIEARGERKHEGAARLCERLRSMIPAMRGWLAAMSHPDGKISFFNDAAFGVAPGNDALEAYAQRLGFDAAIPTPAPLTDLSASGYARLSAGPAVVIADIAAIGPSYLPGHAHADTLSFEMSLFGHRLIVNSGTSVYGLGEERSRQRGTTAHSTVTLENTDSSEMWGGFRVARRARITERRVTQDGAALLAEGSHDGYRRLDGGPVHRRRWRLTETSLDIEDTVGADTAGEARFHLHPQVTARLDDGTGVLDLPDGRSAKITTGAGAARLEISSWHPEFGLSERCTVLVLQLKEGRAHLRLDWES